MNRSSFRNTTLALFTALAAPCANAELLNSSPQGFTIENSIVVPVDQATAWKGLVHDVNLWWPKDHSWWGKDGKFSIEPRAGGCFCETSGKRQALHMTVSFVDPGVLLRMLGGLGPLQGMGLNGALDWKFEKVDEGTRIVMHYTGGGYTTEDLVKFAPIVDQVMGTQLGGLGKHLSRPRPPHAPPAAEPKTLPPSAK